MVELMPKFHYVDQADSKAITIGLEPAAAGGQVVRLDNGKNALGVLRLNTDGSIEINDGGTWRQVAWFDDDGMGRLYAGRMIAE